MSDDDGDRLDAIRAQLEEVNELDVGDRPEVFALVNEAIAAELGAMEDV